jgi:hypothetical protein
MARIRWGRKAHRRQGTLRRGAQVVDGEGVPLVLEVDGEVYEERGASVRF